jgi:phage N-6-adenine-methyltransferase
MTHETRKNSEKEKRKMTTRISQQRPKTPRMNKGMFSSSCEDWETPQEFFDTVNAKFHFTLDVCATPANAKCTRYFTKKDDSLSRCWEGICWMNPPYGREIGKWVRKAYESALNGATVVCLLPARTDTAWWHDYVLPYTSGFSFIRGRLRFSGKGPAPFPSAVVIFGNFPEGVLSAITGISSEKRAKIRNMLSSEFAQDGIEEKEMER